MTQYVVKNINKNKMIYKNNNIIKNKSGQYDKRVLLFFKSIKLNLVNCKYTLQKI